MKILIAGAAGFIGSNLAEVLLSSGHALIGVDDFITGSESNIQRLSAYPAFTFLHQDILHPCPIQGSLDWVMHFASPACPRHYLAHPMETLRANSEGTGRLLELARAKGARFLLASTSEVYGDPEVHPQPESYWGRVNPVGPRSVYDESKRYAEAATMAYHRCHGLSTRIIRIFNTYGPYMSSADQRVVPNFIRRALQGLPLPIQGDGSQTRSFQYIDDLIRGITALMEVEFSQPVNLGNPEEHSILELAEMIGVLTGNRTEFLHGLLPEDDPRQRKPDISLALRLLPWRPEVPLLDGLQKMISHLRCSEKPGPGGLYPITAARDRQGMPVAPL